MAQEYRGCRSLVYAEVLTDTATGMTFGEVKPFAPVQTIAHNPTRNSATSFYDDLAANSRVSEGADAYEFTIAVPEDAVMADIEGKYYDPTKKIYSDSPITNKYFAVGYVLGEEGDAENESFVWKNKGTFQIGSTTHQTKDDGTDVTNVSVTYTSIYPHANFTHGGKTGSGGRSKGVRVLSGDDVMTEADFFDTVQTVDTVYTAAQ